MRGPKARVWVPSRDAVELSLSTGWELHPIRGRSGQVVALEVAETDLLIIHAMKMRPYYRQPYEEALPWRRTP